MALLGKVFTVGAFTALSRVLGLVREMFQSRLIGAGVAQSAFTLAFALPNMSRKLFGEGALTAAFVPVFKGEVERVGVEQASRLARAVMTAALLMLAVATGVALAGLFAADAAAGWTAFTGSDRRSLTLSLVIILVPYMIAICGAAFGMGVLNALGKFKASSFMPCLLNLVWIGSLGTLAFFPEMPVETRVRIVAGSILAAGFLQTAFMFRCMAKVGVSPRPLFSDWRTVKARLVWRNTAVAAVGAGAIQINYMLDQFLAQMAAPWAAGVIGYAERLMDLPLGVIGVAFGTVLLPTFAGLFARGDSAGARMALAGSVKSLMFVMLPAAAGLFVLAHEITSVIYEGGDFDAVATLRVSRALAVYALGLGFFGIQKSIVPWFQAQNDMKTPLYVSTGTVVVNAVLNIMAVWLLPIEWRHVGLASSTVFCAFAGMCALVVLARRKNGPLGLSGCIMPVVKMLVSAVIMALAVWALRPSAVVMGALAFGGWGANVVSLGILMTAGAIVYFALMLALMRGKVRALLRRAAIRT